MSTTILLLIPCIKLTSMEGRKLISMGTTKSYSASLIAVDMFTDLNMMSKID
jgi:hypothetical protein